MATRRTRRSADQILLDEFHHQREMASHTAKRQKHLLREERQARIVQQLTGQDCLMHASIMLFVVLCCSTVICYMHT